MKNNDTPISKYIIWFSCIYTIHSIITASVLIYFDIDASSPGFIILLAAIYSTVQKFIKDHGRSLEKNEIWKFTWWSFTSSMLINALFILCLYLWLLIIDDISTNDMKAMFSETGISSTLILGIMLFVIALSLGATRFGYSFFNKLVTKKFLN